MHWEKRVDAEYAANRAGFIRAEIEGSRSLVFTGKKYEFSFRFDWILLGTGQEKSQNLGSSRLSLSKTSGGNDFVWITKRVLEFLNKSNKGKIKVHLTKCQLIEVTVSAKVNVERSCSLKKRVLWWSMGYGGIAIRIVNFGALRCIHSLTSRPLYPGKGSFGTHRLGGGL